MEKRLRTLMNVKIVVIIATILVTPLIMHFYYAAQAPSWVEIPSRVSMETPHVYESRFPGGKLGSIIDTSHFVPDYEIQTCFDRDIIPPYYTEYWVASSEGGAVAAKEIQGWHTIIDDNGLNALILHSDNVYQVGFGDHIWGYGPPSVQPNGEDISDRVCDQPLYYFGYVPGGAATSEGRPFVPAYSKFEITLAVKPVQQRLPFAVDQWTFFGKSEVDVWGNSMGILLYQNNTGLYYNWGNFPNQPYFKKIADGYYANTTTYMPIDVLYDYSYGNHTLGTATISWGSLKVTVQSVRERVGYSDTWPFFYNTEVTLTQPGELLVRNVDIRFWGKVPGGPPQPTAWVSGQPTW